MNVFALRKTNNAHVMCDVCYLVRKSHKINFHFSFMHIFSLTASLLHNKH